MEQKIWGRPITDNKKVDWEAVGCVLELLCEDGFYPALGYDVNGWEAWVFLDEPMERQVGEHIKAFAKTPVEAIERLIMEIFSEGFELSWL